MLSTSMLLQLANRPYYIRLEISNTKQFTQMACVYYVSVKGIQNVRMNTYLYVMKLGLLT